MILNSWKSSFNKSDACQGARARGRGRYCNRGSVKAAEGGVTVSTVPLMYNRFPVLLTAHKPQPPPPLPPLPPTRHPLSPVFHRNLHKCSPKQKSFLFCQFLARKIKISFTPEIDSLNLFFFFFSGRARKRVREGKKRNNWLFTVDQHLALGRTRVSLREYRWQGKSPVLLQPITKGLHLIMVLFCFCTSSLPQNTPPPLFLWVPTMIFILKVVASAVL